MNIVVSSRILVHKDFHYIINGHCKNHFGHHFVEEGDYTIIRTTDNYIMDPSELANEVESEMIFEMSIVIWAKKGLPKEVSPMWPHKYEMLSQRRVAGLSGKFLLDFSACDQVVD